MIWNSVDLRGKYTRRTQDGRKRSTLDPRPHSSSPLPNKWKYWSITCLWYQYKNYQCKTMPLYSHIHHYDNRKPGYSPSEKSEGGINWDNDFTNTDIPTQILSPHCWCLCRYLHMHFFIGRISPIHFITGVYTKTMGANNISNIHPEWFIHG